MKKNLVSLDNFNTPVVLNNIDNLIVKIRQCTGGINLKEWMEEYQVPDGTQPSHLPFPECMRLALAWREQQRLNDFPATKISNLLETHDLSMTVEKIVVSPAFEEENPQEVVLPNVQSFYVEKDDKIDVTVIAAQAAAYMSFLGRVTYDGSSENTFSLATCKELHTRFVETCDILPVFAKAAMNVQGGPIRSPTLLREMYFSNFIEQKALSLYVWSLFNERTGCGIFNTRVADLVKISKAAHGGLPSCSGHTHVIKYLPFPKCGDVDTAFKIHHNHTQARGEEKGSGVLAASFYWNTLSKSVAKILYNVVPIIDVCLKRRIMIIQCENGLLSDYEKNMLVCNHITVIDPGFRPPCVENSPVGIYGTTNLPHIYFSVLKGVAPTIASGVVTPNFDPEFLSSLLPITKEIFMCRMYMHPGLESVVKKSGLYFYPVLNCSRPEVYVTNEKFFSEDVKMVELAQRCAKANYYKTMFPSNSLPFGIVDKYRPIPFFTNPVKFPRRGGKPVVAVKPKTIMEVANDVNSDKVWIYELPENYSFLDEDKGERPLPQSSFRDSNRLESLRQELLYVENRKLTGTALKKTGCYKLFEGMVTNNSLIVPSLYKCLFDEWDIQDIEDELTNCKSVIGMIVDAISIPLRNDESYGTKSVPKPPPSSFISLDNFDLTGLSKTMTEEVVLEKGKSPSLEGDDSLSFTNM